MARRIGSALVWIGRGAAFALGVIVVGVLLPGPAGDVLGQAVDRLRLGRNNPVDRLTRISGDLSSTILRIDNTGSGPALDLRVDSNRPPLTVNSAARVVNLNADQLDGLDSAEFSRRRDETRFVRLGIATYEINSSGTDAADAADAVTAVVASCNAGDLLQAGGYVDLSPNGIVQDSAPGGPSAWRVEFRTEDGAPATVTVRIRCFDFPPLRP